MKNIMILLVCVLALTACKDQKGNRKNQADTTSSAAEGKKEGQEFLTLEELAMQSVSQPNDWVGDLGIYVETILTCANSSPVPVKYVFKADSFESQDLTLVLYKAEDEKVYACSFGKNTTIPEFRQIRLTPPAKSERFYPGELPKVDSCLNNTRILDKSGRTAGWLSRITC